jgi:hypothetical protein
MVPLLGDQLSVPAQDGIGRKERADVAQDFTAEDLPLTANRRR